MKEVAYELSLVKPVERNFTVSKKRNDIVNTESGQSRGAKSGKIKLIHDQNNVTIHKMVEK
jgi:hypothetical protein